MVGYLARRKLGLFRTNVQRSGGRVLGVGSLARDPIQIGFVCSLVSQLTTDYRLPPFGFVSPSSVLGHPSSVLPSLLCSSILFFIYCTISLVLFQVKSAPSGDGPWAGERRPQAVEAKDRSPVQTTNVRTNTCFGPGGAHQQPRSMIRRFHLPTSIPCVVNMDLIEVGRCARGAVFPVVGSSALRGLWDTFLAGWAPTANRRPNKERSATPASTAARPARNCGRSRSAQTAPNDRTGLGCL